MQHFDRHFRWRGDDITRVEGLSDAVFGFSITLLVVSLDVPHTFDDLLMNMKGFITFGFSFMLLLNIWYKHFIFFRRFRFLDKQIMLLNAALLFMVLFYIYPLKFLFSLINVQWILNMPSQETIRDDQYPLLIQCFSGGYTIISTIFLLMYRHAYKLKDHFELNAKECLVVHYTMVDEIMRMAIGISSMLLTLIPASWACSFAGWIYLLIAPLAMLFGRYETKSIQQLNE